jgi:hypothetical protein
MRFLIAFLFCVTFSTVAPAQPITGTYKLISFTSDYGDGASVTPFGPQPTGYIIITPKRFMAMLVSDTRRPGATAEDRIALFNSVIAYSGPYKLEGSRLVTDVDISWNQAWTGTKQGRTLTIDGNRLTLVTDRAPSGLDPSRTVSARLVWEKVE